MSDGPKATAHRGFQRGTDGMSLRDYFAAKAMSALIAKTPLLDDRSEYGTGATSEKVAEMKAGISESAYGYADAMLKARSSK